MIKIEQLSYCWASEEVFQPRHYDGETIRDIGDGYIEELVRRNMIISERDDKTLRFEHCLLHDMMREVCLFKAKEENFLQITSHHPPTANSQCPCISCRLVCQYPATLHIGSDTKNPKLQSLVVLQVDYYVIEPCKLSISSFTRLELLRVLDLFKADFRGQKLPSCIGKLIHLRYLSLEQVLRVSHLPSSLGNVKFLIYLCINVTATDIFVPNVLNGMQDLRYLALPIFVNKKTKLELSNLVNLEELKNFSTWIGSLMDLNGMSRLRTLQISLTGEITLKTLHASISGLKHLENLEIQDRADRTLEEVFALDFVHLKNLNLNMHMPRLPRAHFLSHLTILHLSDYSVEEDLISILEKLFNLKRVSLWIRSFFGRRMVCSVGGFPQLQNISLFKLEEWEEWIIEEGSMPLLHSLDIWEYQKLKRLPDGLRFITSLKELDTYSHKNATSVKSQEWKQRLGGGEDYYKVQHIPFIKL